MTILLIYWPILHSVAIKEFAGTPKELALYTGHSLPQITFALNYMVTDVNLIPSHGIYLMAPVGIAFAFVNWFTVKFVIPGGKNPYFFIGDWDTI